MIGISIGATIEHEGRQIGQVESVILDRESQEATDLIVRYGNPINPDRRLMPTDWVIEANHKLVRINHSEQELRSLPLFEVQHYVRLDQAREELAQTRARIRPTDWVNYFVPLVANAFGDPYHTPGIIVTDQMLVPSESAIDRGLPVETSDGHHIGHIHEVLLSEPDWRLSGIIIERGFVRAHPMRLPADWLARIHKDRITLNRTKEQIELWEREQA